MNPYACTHDVAEPRTWANFWRLMVAVCLLFVLPSLLIWGYLQYEQEHPTLFQTYENATMSGKVEQWQKMHDSDIKHTR